MGKPIFIAGRWREGRGETIASHFPADGSLNAEVAGASAEDVAEAVEAGRRAMDDPAWRDLRPHERARHLSAIAAGIERRAEEIARVQTRDTGKTLAETRALVASAAGTFRYMAAALETLEEELTPPRGDCLTMSLHEPIGVVGAITPWNSPIASDAQKVAPALAAGNAVVLKPAAWSPLVCLELARVIEEAGLPAGLFSALPGSGAVAGDALVRHPLVAKVSFTGGTATGRGIAHAAADKLMPVSLELGGKSPNIVFADADLDAAVAGALYGIFSSSGQSCIAGSRLFVERPVYDAFVERLVAGARRLRVGHPERPGTQVAPLIHPRHRDGVEAYVRLAVEEGGEVLAGGTRPEGAEYAAGCYLLPTVIAGLSNRARVCQEEIFGPVVVVLPFDDEDALIAEANDSVYGLAAGIWSADYRRIWRVARRLRTGTVWINTYKQFSISTPFGGVKESGLGREKGRQGIRAYMNQKSLYWSLAEAPLPWAGGAA
ncbi:aldehyde dehydrogenase [Azospirillum sp. ST 5-10]|uniref:aldehyde dehydrogenase n=1 Tax=unclassified Azospirillum TaxID=2630922 RepID=UPI003F4A6B6D